MSADGDGVDRFTNALRELGKAIANADDPKEEYVFAVIRGKECPGSFAWLTHEGKHDSWFLPGGKVEDGE